MNDRIRFVFASGSHMEYPAGEWLHGLDTNGDGIFRPASEYLAGYFLRPAPDSSSCWLITRVELVLVQDEGGGL